MILIAVDATASKIARALMAPPCKGHILLVTRQDKQVFTLLLVWPLHGIWMKMICLRWHVFLFAQRHGKGFCTLYCEQNYGARMLCIDGFRWWEDVFRIEAMTTGCISVMVHSKIDSELCKCPSDWLRLLKLSFLTTLTKTCVIIHCSSNKDGIPKPGFRDHLEKRGSSSAGKWSHLQGPQCYQCYLRCVPILNVTCIWPYLNPS